MNHSIPAAPIAPNRIDREPAARLAAIGEACFFLAQVGHDWLPHFDSAAPVAGACFAAWWDSLTDRGQLYFAQYLQVPAHFDFILYPTWAQMSAAAQSALAGRLVACIRRAGETLETANRS